MENRDPQDLHAQLTWKMHYVTDEENESTTKTGELWYTKAKPVAKFLIRFDEKREGTRADKLDERYLFDGQWYVRLDSRTKIVERRELRKANDPGDPYKLGRGPFPVPFGQKKADIVREFDVTLVPPGKGDPADTDHLKLVPRVGTQIADTYRQLDFWIAREGPLDGFPLKVLAAKLKGTGQLDSYITTEFTGAQLNTGLKAELFEIKTPTGYHEDMERLEDISEPTEKAATPGKAPGAP